MSIITEAHGERLNHLVRFIVIRVLLVIPFIVSNARMLNTLPGYSTFGLLTGIPKPLLYASVLTIVFFSYFIFFKRKEKYPITLFIFLLVYFCAMSFFWNSLSIIPVIQGVFYFFTPIVVFGIFFNCDDRIIDLEKTVNFYILTGIINIPIACYLFLKYSLTWTWQVYNPLDAVNALFSDSHTYAFFLLFLLFLLSYKISDNRKKGKNNLFNYSIFSLSILLFVFTFNEKLILIVIICFFFYFIFYVKTSFLLKSFVILILAGFSAYVYAFISYRLNKFLMLYSYVDIPFVKAYTKSLDVFLSYPSTIIFGSGFGEYGTVIVNTNVKNGYFPNLAYKYNYMEIQRIVNPHLLSNSRLELLSSSLQISVNTFTSLLVESGLLIGSCIYYFYFSLTHKLAFKSKNSMANLSRLLVIFFICMFIYSNVSIYGSFDDFVVTYPFLIISALILKTKDEDE